MGNKKITLNNEVVKYLFSGVDCEVAPGEDGYIVYGFSSLLPSKLGLFIPIEIDRSGYSAVFPKSFEAYFSNLDEEFSYLSRLLEVDLKNDFLGYGLEYIPGMMLKRDSETYTIFRFDELMNPEEKTDMLCRIRSDSLELFSRLLGSKPYFLAETATLDGKIYFYFILPLSKFFRLDDRTIAAVFSFLRSTRKR